MAISVKKSVFAAAACLMALTVLFTVLFNYLVLSPKDKVQNYKVFEVREGAPFGRIADDLQKEGLIPSSTGLRLWAIYKGYSGKVKAGEYRLSPSMSPWDILEVLRKGEVALHDVTIPEGFNLRQIADVLARQGIVAREEFLRIAQDPMVAFEYGISAGGLEGFLFPDTYRFARAIPARTVIHAMVSRFMEMIAPYRGKQHPMGLSMEELVTLASIVEKETAKAEEKPTVASVFLNRLKKKMPLASDPTVIYAIDDFDGNLTRRDLANPSPYNTYRQKGLPPGPIASPGIESIKAVIYPPETEYLFFVSRNDGTHVFSKTYEEHARAVSVYQKKRSGTNE
ncbi:MAG: endolytic transglycosylase MltG [Desulfobacteraceae bacterium]|jgi:UPF0755 protein|nr:MAG: endolytic transglycosylase MltG [Desulfobacteraceae bacterium]